MNPIRRALDQSGVNATSLDRIRLARGVVGKTSYVALATVLTLGGIAGGIAWTSSNPIYPFVLAILIVVVVMAYLASTFWFANRNPGIALLEGAELIQWRQMDIAARTIPSIENEPVLEPDTRKSE
jgi:hypothetical protein